MEGEGLERFIISPKQHLLPPVLEMKTTDYPS